MKFGKTEGPLETAVRLLARRELTEKEIRFKLLRKEISRTEIDEVIETLREKGYINDERVSQRTIEKLVADKKLGARGISEKLRQRGLQVSGEIIRESCSEEDEWSIALALVQKHFSSLDVDTVPRIVRFLGNRGFSSGILRRVVDECRKHQ
jgi:regulatory protein